MSQTEDDEISYYNSLAVQRWNVADKELNFSKGANMQIQGNITHIQPTQQGGYNCTPQDSAPFYMYTFDMTVNGPSGPVTGEIGSKSQQYPMQIGEQIIVNSTTTQHGIKFKKVNPQYQGGGQQQGGGQSQQNQQPQQRPQQRSQQPLPGPDATGRMIIAQVSAKIVAELMVGTQLTFNSTADMQVAINDWFTAIINVGSGNVAQPQQQDQSQAHDYDQQSQDIPY